MKVLANERAQALQVGAVLLFGILVILFAVWQAFVIPDQNERVEFDHNQQVQSEIVELRGDIVSASDANTPTSGTVQLGTRFPTRLLFINPSPAAGSLQTERVGEGGFTIENAAVAGDGGAGQFWNGTEREYDSVSLAYAPEYREFSDEPTTVYDNTVVYNDFRDAGEGATALTEQAIVDGDRITLVSLVGEYSETGTGSVTPDIQPVSTQSRAVPIENTTENGEPANITIELSTRLSDSQWDRLLDEEDNVVGVNQTGDETVELELAAGQYELQMAQVGVGEGLTSTNPAYIEVVDGGGEEIRNDQNHTVTAEVRDRFNVPQNNVNVTAAVNESGGEIRPQNQATAVDGQATFEFDPDASNLSNGDEVELEFGWGEDVPEHDERVENTTVNLTVGGDDTLEIRWTDVPEPEPCERDGTDYFIECDYNTEQMEGDYELSAVSGNATGVEAQFFHTNTTQGEIEAGEEDPALRAEFDEDGEIEIEFDAIDPEPHLDAETTLVAHAEGETETLLLHSED